MWMLIMKLPYTEMKFYPKVKSQKGLSSLRVSSRCALNSLEIELFINYLTFVIKWLRLAKWRVLLLCIIPEKHVPEQILSKHLPVASTIFPGEFDIFQKQLSGCILLKSYNLWKKGLWLQQNNFTKIVTIFFCVQNTSR